MVFCRACAADHKASKKENMSTSAYVPILVKLGIYRISREKQETLLKLMVLSTAAILCK